MNRRPKRERHERREPRTKAGEVLLSHNHLCLLHGLYDRPDVTAMTTNDWIGASLPYTRLFRRHASAHCLRASIATIHLDWVETGRYGRRRQWSLTPRGRAILDLEVPTRIRGYGQYAGLRELRRCLAERAPRVESAADYAARTDGWWEVARRTMGDALIDGVIRHLVNWSLRHRVIGIFANMQHSAHMEMLRRYLCDHVMRTEKLPSGLHRITSFPGGNVVFEVDFDSHK
jgi:hypothetical protein